MSDESLSSDDVENLLKSMSGDAKPEAEAAEGESLSNDDVENLLKSMSGDAKPEAEQSEDESLSADDVENLLKSMAGGDSAADVMQTQTAGTATASDRAKPRAAPKQRVLSYDFKRPERVGKEQMRALQSLHEGLGRNFGAALSAMLRTIAEVKLVSVDQLTYSEFVYSLEIPTCFNLLTPKPLEGNWIVDISPSLLYPVIDRMLGGAVSDESTLKRPLSEIELRLARRVTGIFLKELSAAWRNVIELDLEVERVESNPQLVQIVPPNEVVIMVSFEATIGKARGMTNLCIPFNTIERIGTKLSNNSWLGYSSARHDPDSSTRIAHQLDGSSIPIVVSLARSKIKASELVDLQVGDIISTEKDCHSPLEVEIARSVKFHAKAGAFKGRKAIQIEQVLHTKPTEFSESKRRLADESQIDNANPADLPPADGPPPG
jgi:flagellar motor switch protein FliM